ncbi:glycosyltransferase family 4 protein [Streptomyces sp. NPDC002790]|uniref:glycosyltransferase family 4 protein n=1 Tax=Streptomyces sp. NPDC002790 TaxID=3154431 RepID=UPI00332DBC0D
MSTVLAVFGGYPDSRVTGASLMAWRTTAALAARGHRVALLTDSRCPEDLADADWPVFTSVAQLSGTAWSHPDYVHVYDLASPAHAELGRELAARSGATLVLTPASAPETWPDPALGRRVSAEATALFVLTETEATTLCSIGIPTDRIGHIPQAPDLAGPGDGDAFRARHDIGGPLVLFVGRHVPAKGYELLLDAAPSVWERVPEAVFAFAGPDEGEDVDAAFNRRADARIRRLGLLSDAEKHDALAGCAVLCLPTSADVFPLVFVEAWSCGRPVVSGRFTGCLEVVREGVDGLLVDHTPLSVASALLKLLQDDALRAALGAAGQARVDAELSWDQAAAAVERGCRMVVSEPAVVVASRAPSPRPHTAAPSGTTADALGTEQPSEAP